MAFRSASALFLLSSLVLKTAAQRNCWFPDGSTETQDVPCNANAEESACCGPNAFCLNNGLCMENGVISRGSCTDRDWADPACAKECTSENTSNGLALINCDAKLSSWICAANGNSCDNDAVVFGIDKAGLNQIALRPAQDAASAEPLLITPTSSINNGTAAGGENGSTVITTVTASAAPPSSAHADAQFTTAQMAGVGAGVGIPLLLALFAAVFVIMKQRKRLRAAEAFGKEHELRPTAPHMPYGGYDGQEQKMQTSAAYYRPISPQPPAGHFREMEVVQELDGQRGRQELEVPK